LLFASVDPDVAVARGIPARRLSVLFLVVLGAAVAEAAQITGALLAERRQPLLRGFRIVTMG
jgi:zinc/manganese transport system permease protein